MKSKACPRCSKPVPLVPPYVILDNGRLMDFMCWLAREVADAKVQREKL